MYVWCGKFCSERTDKAILGVWYGYDAHIYDAFSHDFDPDTCMYDAYIYVPRSLILIHACMMHKAMILALDPEACMYAWCIYDSGPWSWMYDACNNASFSRICVYMMLPDACMHDAYIYYSWPFTLMHVCMMHRCMMHNAQIYDSVPWSWWCMNLGRWMYMWCSTF